MSVSFSDPHEATRGLSAGIVKKTVKKWMHELEKCETPHFGHYKASCFPKCLMDYKKGTVQPGGEKNAQIICNERGLICLVSSPLTIFSRVLSFCLL